jgi:hypothetical protein
MTEARRPAWLLAPLGALVVLATIAGSFVFPLTPIRMTRTSAELIDLSGVWSALAAIPWPVPTDGPVIAASLLMVGAIAIAAYAGAVVVAWDRPATRRTLAFVLVPAAIALGVSTLAFPTQSSDIVDYLLSGRVAIVHGESPYTTAPDAFPDDPLRPYASGRYTTDPEAKPPVWLGAAIGAAALTADAEPADAVLTARMLFLALTILNATLIAVILRRWRPRHVLAGLVLYTWSPVVLLHGQAKFDTLMATFALLAGLALVHARPVASIAALWLSVLVKLLTLPLVAVSVLGDLAARQWRRVVISGVLIAVMTVVLYVPFGAGIPEMIGHLTAAAGSGTSLPRPVSLAVMAVAGIAVLWAGLRARGETEGTLQGWAVAAIATIPLGLTGSAWYLLMPIAVVSLSGERWRTAILIAASAIAFLIDSWTRHSNADYPLPVPFGLSRTEALLLGLAILIIGLVAGAGLAAWSRRRGAGGGGRDAGARSSKSALTEPVRETVVP